jgi:hypothetical protein
MGGEGRFRPLEAIDEVRNFVQSAALDEGQNGDAERARMGRIHVEGAGEGLVSVILVALCPLRSSQ